MNDQEFHVRLLKLRKARGLSQTKLCELSGVDQRMISHYERGEKLPRLPSIKALCTGLGCTASELLGF